MQQRFFNSVEQQIQQFFYNVLANHLLDNNNVTPQNIKQELIKSIVMVIQQLIELSKNSQGLQLPSMLITANNCPTQYKPFFDVLMQAKKRLLTEQELITVAHGITQLPSFKEIDPTQFVLEAKGQIDSSIQHIQYNQENITPTLIRDTFYNEMVAQALNAVEKRLFSEEDILSQETYVFFGLPALTLLEAIQQSKHCDGIRLLNDKMLTLQNCPNSEKFPEFTEALLSIKKQVGTLSADQLETMKYVLTEQENIPENLAQLKTKEFMETTAIINNIAIEISRQEFFHHIINDVLKTCCETLSSHTSNSKKPSV